MKTSKAYKKFLRSHRRSIDMIRRHLYHYKNQHNKWSEYDDDLFRAGIIFSVAAMDAYFTDRFCESFDPYIRKFGLNKEMDKLLGTFTQIYINQLTDDELPLLCDLLDLDDENLYKLNQGMDLTIEIKINKVTKLFQNYVYDA